MDVADYLELPPAPAVALRQARERGDEPRFFVPDEQGGWEPVTWRDHAASIRAFAAALDERFDPGDRGAIFAANSVAWAEAALGLQAAGLTVVPIYPASTAEQAGYVIRHSGARVLFVAGEAQLERVHADWESYAGVECIVVLDDADPALDPAERADRFISRSALRAHGIARDEEDPQRVDAVVAGIDPSRAAIMLYTSGTTGDPKGVPLSHDNLATNTRDWLRCNAKLLHEDGVDLLWLPMSHIFGFGELCLGNILGMTSYLGTPATVLELMPQVRPTVFMSVPAYWEKLAAGALAADTPEDARQALAAATGGRLRYCLSGGAGLARAVKEAFEAAGMLILEGYGLTECSPTLTLNRPDDYRFDSVGKPVPSVELKLADDGEILARGPSIFGGYHDNPTATAAAFDADGWFCTGDIGRWTEDGFLQIVDRKKEILVTAGGKNVPPANIERRIAADPAVAHAVVYGDGKRYLVAGVWLDPAQVGALRQAERAERAAAAVEAANAKLARFEQIKRFCVVEAPLSVEGGHLTSTLKLRRKRIYAEFAEQFEGLYR